MSGEQLPFPWEIRYSSSKGANYFYNPSNGVSTWNHPSLEADHPNQSPYPSHIHAGQPTHNRARDDRYAQSQQINRPSTRAPLSTQPQSTAARSALQPHQSADRGRVEAWTSSGNSVGGSGGKKIATRAGGSAAAAGRRGNTPRPACSILCWNNCSSGGGDCNAGCSGCSCWCSSVTE